MSGKRGLITTKNTEGHGKGNQAI